MLLWIQASACVCGLLRFSPLIVIGCCKSDIAKGGEWGRGGAGDERGVENKCLFVVCALSSAEWKLLECIVFFSIKS